MNLLNGWGKLRWSGIDRKSPLEIDLRAEYENLLPIEAAKSAIELITKTHPPPYHIYCSGGLDSQMLIWCWIQSGKEFVIRHVDYNNGMNSHDTESLRKYCRRRKLSYETVNFDVVRFLDSAEFKELAIRYDCSSPQILTYIKMISLDPATCIMSGNYISSRSCGLNYTILGLQRFADIDKKNFIPFFLLYTPALAYTFFDTDLEFRRNNKEAEQADYKAKFYTLSQYDSFAMPQESKFTGFEKIKELYDLTPVSGRQRMAWIHKASNRPFDILYRYALLDIIGNHSEDYCMIHNQSLEMINTQNDV